MPESDVAGVDAPELLLLGETALVTRAGDAPTLLQPRGVTPRRGGSIARSKKTGEPMQHADDALPTMGMESYVEFGSTAMECQGKARSCASTKANKSAGTQGITT